jgi:mRNA-degrading endonuclease toxin of MazEF toxin-antitoxin module
MQDRPRSLAFILRSKIGPRIGRVDKGTMNSVDQALRGFFGL